MNKRRVVLDANGKQRVVASRISLQVRALISVERKRAPVCVLIPGRALDYFTLRVPLYTGETPKTGLALPEGPIEER
jgi:hypothetical protein